MGGGEKCIKMMIKQEIHLRNTKRNIPKAPETFYQILCPPYVNQYLDYPRSAN